jgi:hypothetical protein
MVKRLLYGRRSHRCRHRFYLSLHEVREEECRGGRGGVKVLAVTASVLLVALLDSARAS